MQPKALSVLAFAQMCRFFSHYGVRSVLVLYMIQALAFNESKAISISAITYSLIELSAFAGGILADKYFGLRKAVLLGALLLAASYLLLTQQDAYFIALGLIILGSSLFSGNISALLGKAYESTPTMRKEGFTYFYMIQNLGALISVILTGFIAQKFGFTLALTLAGCAMVLANIALALNLKTLKKIDPSKSEKKTAYFLLPIFLLFSLLALVNASVLLPFLPIIIGGSLIYFAIKTFLPMSDGKKMLIFLGALILFFAIEDQIFSTLLLFTEQNVNRTIFGITIPSTFIVCMNPIIVLLLGSKIAKQKVNLFWPFLLVSIAFFALALASYFSWIPSFIFMILLITLISAAELMIGPAVYAFAAEISEEINRGRVMGIVSLAFSTAVLLGGNLSQAVNHFGYTIGFGLTCLITLSGGILLQLFYKKCYLLKINEL